MYRYHKLAANQARERKVSVLKDGSPWYLETSGGEDRFLVGCIVGERLGASTQEVCT
jgi:hypothetical protein